jgi:ABC-type sugar transport system ATPase subunit
MASVPPYKRPVNMMFQSYALFPHMSVWNNVAYGLKRDHLTRADIDARVAELLKLVKLEGYDSANCLAERIGVSSIRQVASVVRLTNRSHASKREIIETSTA